MINIAIVEDEEEVRKRIVEIIFSCNYDMKIDEYEKGELFLNALKKKKSDIYILDIELESEMINGYDLAQKIREIDQSAIIIFLSSHTEYACAAFEVDTLRFLQKPLIEEKIKEAIEKAVVILRKNNESVYLKLERMQKKIMIKDILYVESKLRKVCMKIIDGKEYNGYATMNEMEKILNPNIFVKIHRSFIISMYYIDTVIMPEVVLENGEKISIGRKYKDNFQKKYADYIKGRIL